MTRYTMDTTGTTQGETPSKTYAVSAQPSFDLGSGFVDAVTNTDSYEYVPAAMEYSTDTDMNDYASWVKSGDVYSDDTDGNIGVIRIGDVGSAWSGSFGKVVSGLTIGEEYTVQLDKATDNTYNNHTTNTFTIRDGSSVGSGSVLASLDVDYSLGIGFKLNFIASSTSANIEVDSTTVETDCYNTWTSWHVWESRFSSPTTPESFKTTRTYNDLIDSTGSQTVQSKVELRAENDKMTLLQASLMKKD